MFGNEPRVELGGTQPLGPEAVAPQAPGLADADAQFIPSMAASWLA